MTTFRYTDRDDYTWIGSLEQIVADLANAIGPRATQDNPEPWITIVDDDDAELGYREIRRDFDRADVVRWLAVADDRPERDVNAALVVFEGKLYISRDDAAHWEMPELTIEQRDNYDLMEKVTELAIGDANRGTSRYGFFGRDFDTDEFWNIVAEYDTEGDE